MGLLNNADLLDLAFKQELKGSTIHLDDDTTKVIDDFTINMAIDQICLKFSDGSSNFFNFREKFKIDTVNIVTIVNKGKVKLHKKDK